MFFTEWSETRISTYKLQNGEQSKAIVEIEGENSTTKDNNDRETDVESDVARREFDLIEEMVLVVKKESRPKLLIQVSKNRSEANKAKISGISLSESSQAEVICFHLQQLGR